MIDLLVFIGRFQPFHNEHKRVIDVALEKAKHVLVLVVLPVLLEPLGTLYV